VATASSVICITIIYIVQHLSAHS